MIEAQKECVIAYGGGMDSLVTLAIVCEKAFEKIHLLHIDYGQEAAQAEWKAMRSAAMYYHPHDTRCIWTNRIRVGSSAGLFGLRQKSNIPDMPHFVPARNMVLLSLAANYALAYGIKVIAWGGQGKGTICPDVQRSFITAFWATLQIGNAYPDLVTYSPLIDMDKQDIVREGNRLYVPWDLSWSCFREGPTPCGMCAGCRRREEAFNAVGG